MDLNGLALCAKTGHQESFGQEELLRRMEEDAQISETLRDRIRAQPACASLDTIFVTGGTGTLGAAMIGLLLLHTEHQLVCLVRQKHRDGDAARVRLLEAVCGAQMWSELPREYGGRVSVVCGDLGEECFGMEEVEYRTMTITITIIECFGMDEAPKRPPP